VRRHAAVAVLVLVLSGCTAETSAPATFASPFAGCDTLPPGTASASASVIAAKPADLPDLTLPCFDGKQQVALRGLRGPLVVNLWASWCQPCRTELPAFQRLADKGKVPVLGVASNDLRDRSASLGEDLGVRFPNVFDADGKLMGALGYSTLPVTIFVAADGRTTVHTAPALTDETLAALVKQHLGVA
jgi:cytochrome c biogenesis protein CcmG/thiol:disulfide interchange protein DsbE